MNSGNRYEKMLAHRLFDISVDSKDNMKIPCSRNLSPRSSGLK